MHTKKSRLLIVDDDKSIRWTLAETVRGWGFVPTEAGSIADALALFASEQPVAVLLDIELPDGSGLDALLEIKRQRPDAVVIMITGNSVADSVVSALRGGAYDYISKPIHLESLRVALRNGLEAHELRQAMGQVRKERATRFDFSQIIGEAAGMKQTLDLARKVAISEVSAVLLQGESGTGKDLVAKAIHIASRRGNQPFVAINCAALPATLIESELFGYEKGAFTDAKGRKEGLFEQAEGGTLFLDEIGELELGLQAKLLRVLEEGMFRRVGGLKDLALDVRVIAASNRDLKRESTEARFRADLYYRLSVIQIDIPALRDRGSDVLLIADHFISMLSERLRPGRKLTGFTREVSDVFTAYRWPGNVRELRNVVERAMILEDGETVTATYLPRDLLAATGAWVDSGPARGTADTDVQFRLPANGLSLEAVEMSLVRQAIERSGGNQTRAAELLGISRDQLRYRLKKLEDADAAADKISA